MGKPIEKVLWELLVGKPSKSSGRRKKAKKSASHPIVAVRAAAARINEWRANGLEQGRKTKARSAAATLKRDKEIAAKRKAAATRKAAKATQARARKAAAEARAQQTADRPQVVRAHQVHVHQSRTIRRPGETDEQFLFRGRSEASSAQTRKQKAIRPGAPRVTPRPVSAAAAPGQPSSVLCGSRETDDGEPCRNPTTGGPCSAAHKPRNQPKPVGRPTTQTGARNVASGNDRISAQVGRGGGGGTRPPAPAANGGRSDGGNVTTIVSGNARVGQVIGSINGPVNIRMGARTTDWAGRPLTPESAEFYRLRDVEGYKGPINWTGGNMPFKVDENGNRI